jgi:hypothetical protein
MNSTNQKVIGIVLICFGLLLAVPFIPKIVIFCLGAYLILLGIKMVKGDWFDR